MRKILFPALLAAFTFFATPVHAQSILCSGGAVSCVLPGATFAANMLVLSGQSGVSVVTVAKTDGTTTVLSNSAPTSCTGDGCALAAGSTNSAGKLTTTTIGASAPVIAFSVTFAHAPSCFSNNETTANLSRAISTTTQVTISGVTVSGDTVKYVCLGY